MCVEEEATRGGNWCKRLWVNPTISNQNPAVRQTQGRSGVCVGHTEATGRGDVGLPSDHFKGWLGSRGAHRHSTELCW